MRLTFDTVYRHLNDNISRAAERLVMFQRQVSSGKRVERPSDDPSAAGHVAVARAQLAATDQYFATADSAQSRLTVADTVLTDIVRQLTSAEVVVQAARGTLPTPQQREAWALELEALRDGLLQNVNASFRGTYLFGGAAATTAPYAKNGAGIVSAYQGSTVEVSLDIDIDRSVDVSFNGEALVKGTEVDDLFVVLDRAITATRAGDTDTLNASASELQRAFERATRMQSRVGAALRTVEEGKVLLGESARATKANIGRLEDADLAAAISGMAQADTVYRAALGASAQTQRQSLMDYLR